MYTIITNGSAKIIIKHVKYKLNEQKYFETKTDAQRVIKPWTREAPPPEGGGVCNISLPVLFQNPLWEVRTRGTAASASWSVMIQTTGALSSRECEMPHLLKGAFGSNGNSGASRIYNWKNIFSAPIPLHLFYENVTAQTFIHISNHKVEKVILPFIKAPTPRMD